MFLVEVDADVRGKISLFMKSGDKQRGMLHCHAAGASTSCATLWLHPGWDHLGWAAHVLVPVPMQQPSIPLCHCRTDVLPCSPALPFLPCPHQGEKSSMEERSIQMSSSLCFCEKCMSSLVSAECSLGIGLSYVSWQLNPLSANTLWLTLFFALPMTAEAQAW